jgi:hypothetical protein
MFARAENFGPTHLSHARVGAGGRYAFEHRDL